MQEEDVEDQHSAPAASCVHGSMQVLKSVLLLLLASLISSVFLISVIISGQLMAAQGTGICLVKAGQCSSIGLIFINYYPSPAPSSHPNPSPFSDLPTVH